MRSALDNRVFESALRTTGAGRFNERRIQCVIADTPDDFRDQRRRLAGVSDRDLTFIESAQPYNRGSGQPDTYSGPYVHQLTLLRELSNNDKHQRIVSVAADPNAFELHDRDASLVLDAWAAWTRACPTEYFQSFKPTDMAVDAVAFRADVRRPLRIDDRVVGYAIPHFTLDERRPVIQTLQRIHRYTEWIVRSIGN